MAFFLKKIDMFLATVSNWDKSTMLALSHFHGIKVHHSFVNSGFDWRTGVLNPELVNCYGKDHVKDRDLVLARRAMLTNYRARQISQGPAESVPSKHSDRVLFQCVRDSSDTGSEQSAPGSPNMVMMSPDDLLSLYMNRTELIQQRLAEVPSADFQESEIPIPIQESLNPQVVDTNFVMTRAQRDVALDVIRRNSEKYQNLQAQSESELEGSSDDEDYSDFGEDEDKSSESDDD
jgi:hypothetical protein